MDILSVSSLRGNNNKFLMKQKLMASALSKLFYENRLKWHDLELSKNIRFITVTSVLLSKDYKNLSVFVKKHDFVEDVDLKLIVLQLNKENAVVKTELAKSLRLRAVPRITFKVDDSYEEIAKVESLLDQLKSESK